MGTTRNVKFVRGMGKVLGILDVEDDDAEQIDGMGSNDNGNGNRDRNKDAKYRR